MPSGIAGHDEATPPLNQGTTRSTVRAPPGFGSLHLRVCFGLNVSFETPSLRSKHVTKDKHHFCPMGKSQIHIEGDGHAKTSTAPKGKNIYKRQQSQRSYTSGGGLGEDVPAPSKPLRLNESLGRRTSEGQRGICRSRTSPGRRQTHGSRGSDASHPGHTSPTRCGGSPLDASSLSNDRSSPTSCGDTKQQGVTQSVHVGMHMGVNQAGHQGCAVTIDDSCPRCTSPPTDCIFPPFITTVASSMIRTPSDTLALIMAVIMLAIDLFLFYIGKAIFNGKRF